MLLAWMTYALLVAALAAAAALIAERMLPHRGRWAWATALGVGAGVPLARAALERWLRADGGVSVALGPMAPVMDAALDNLGAVAASATAARLEVPLAGLWVAASGGLLLVLAVGWVRLRLQARGWTRCSVDGTDVLLTENVGPAVVGVVSPRIVVPRWVLALPPQERRLILAHEDEHRLKRDPALLAGALLLPLLAPWNPVLWFAFFRLRHAVEVDCDARVLARGVGSPLGYAHLLFQVGTMPGTPVPLGAGFGERASSLERRIRTMLEEKAKGRAGTLALRSLVALSLLLVACSLEVNIELAEYDDGTRATPPPAEEATAEEVELPATPPVVATPRATEEKMVIPPPPPPPSHVEQVVWPQPAERTRAELEATPTFTPFTVAPSILNRDEVVAAMEASYPPLLRGAGVSGTVKVYFFIDETGRVNKTMIDQGSGHPALDDAALRVAGVYRFEPALNRGEKVPVWVSFPITFRVR